MPARFLYKSYAGFYTFSRWRRRHFTPAGMMVVFAVFLSGILGFNILKTTLYQIMAFGFCVMTVSMVLSLFPFKLKVRIHRVLPEYATVNDTISYEIDITNFSTKTQKGLILYENIQDPRPAYETLLSKKEPFEHLRNTWDRKTLYYRWLWLIRKAGKAQFFPIELPDLPAGETVTVISKIVPQYRGYIHFSGVTFARPDAIGLFNRLFHIKKVQRLLVLPKRYQLETPDLDSTRQYHPGGISLAASIGNSDEFMSLRQYRPGDALRNIHWRTFAKTNELVIKEFEDEYFVRHALILDTVLNSEDETLFEEAVSIASSYITSLQTHESILDLMFVGNRIYSFSSGRGIAHSEKMLEIMACVEPCEDKTVFELMPTLAANIQQFSGAICIFLDWDKGHKKIYQLFKQSALPVFIVVLTENKLKMEEKIFQDMMVRTGIKVVEKGQIQSALGRI
ncbi:MAG: DUF58 domain-containing protein [Proteobacteria bacterium]|nr:DUF58 domain-containing protein [Pseudomonadota bacterium]MBU1581289.1 DUF58 domain-containing protein [Pseudomonadota bacterium]MBU2455588.1 DUF58 domain-containing protein [Pseudomonadota bacterium]MBU2627043.1 DUF58 domain-containing protein [Pseudomonadota bacterium]